MKGALKGTWLGISFDNHWLTLALVVYRRRQPLLRCLHQRPVLTHITETMEQALSSLGLSKFFGSVAVSLPSSHTECIKLEGIQITELKNVSPRHITQLCRDSLHEHGYADSEAWAWDIRGQGATWTLCAIPQEKIQFIKLILGRFNRSLKLITTSDDVASLRSQAETLITSNPKVPAQAVEAVSLTLLGASYETH